MVSHRLSVAFLCLIWQLLSSLANGSEPIEHALRPLIESHHGQVAVAVRILDSYNQTLHDWEHNGQAVMPTASLIKLPIMITAYQQVHEQRIALSDRVTLQESDKVPGSGILTPHFSSGTVLTLRDTIRLMIRYSDNTATNLVLDKIGIASTANAMEVLGFSETQVHSQVYRRDTSIALERSERYGLGSTRANDMVELLTAIEKRELVSSEACDEMLGHLLTCDDAGRFPRFLPPQTLVAHKTGAVNKTRTAAGIIYAPNAKIVLCVLTDDNQDTSWTNDNESHLLCANLAKSAYDFVNRMEDERRSEVTTTVEVGASALSPRELRQGTNGLLVESLQRTLNARIASGLAIDGDFGPATEAAVRTFQQGVGLKVTGVVDRATWQRLGDLEEELPTLATSVEEFNSAVLPEERALETNAAPEVTAKAFAILDVKSDHILASKLGDSPLPNASTTKLMTALLVVELAASSPAVFDEVVTFSRRADETIGSTSGIREGEQVPVGELLYGLMLPSGNDAAVALAEHFGSRLSPTSEEDRSNTRVGAAAEEYPTVDLQLASYDAFMAAMNRKSEALGLEQTRFVNPHGLTEEGHHSSAIDLARLAAQAIELPKMRDYIRCRQRACRLSSVDGYSRTVVWKNTNALLGQHGFSGVKTGTTDAAGACLIALGEHAGKERIVVVLGSTNSEARYVDARNLFGWSWRVDFASTP